MSAASSTGLHSLATLIKRLEAAASRFEDLAELPHLLNPGKGGARPPVTGRPTTDPTEHAGSVAPAPPPPAPPVSSGSTPAPTETPRSVTKFKEDVIEGAVKPFVELNKGFAPNFLVDTARLVEKQYNVLYDFLALAATCQKPDQSTLENLLKPFQTAIADVSHAKEVHRRERDWGNHLTVLAEGAPAIGWIVSPTPGQTLIDVKDPVVYYGNRVKQQFKEKDPKHTEWVNAFVAILNAQQAYVKEFHTAGLVWNPRGITVAQYKSSGTGAAAAPPPPPPPPPPPAAPVAAAPAVAGPAAVFAQLNRGEEVTKGLRKVDKSEMTHKNPALRAGSVVPASSGGPAAKKPAKPTKPQALAGKKPPKFNLDGTKWFVEYYENETITIEETGINQSVNIFNCKGTTVVIKGKVNAVNVLNSNKTSVLVDSVIASVSVASSQSFTLQILGACPMIQLDATDSAQIYLSKTSLNSEITSAKCSAINVSLPVEGEEDGIFEEQPVPEMFKTTVVNGKLVTTIVEHTG